MPPGIIMCEAPLSNLGHPISCNMNHAIRYVHSNATERSRTAFTYFVAAHVEDAEPLM
jgi:hypothetical protein